MTTFDTIDGQIVDQIDSLGNVTEYMHDALGSVTGTTDGSGNLQNTYRWAPYGTRIVKTGTAPDPAFQWLGTLGYRTTSLAHASHYVRARHYGTEQSGWGVVDPLWPALDPYGYCRGNPALLDDATGKAINGRIYVDRYLWTALSDRNCDQCSQSDVSWKFVLNDWVIKLTGWIVQQVTVKYDAHCCGDIKKTPLVLPCSLGATSFTYYEAWQVINGVVMGPTLADPCPAVVGWVAYPTASWENDDWNFPDFQCSVGSASRKGMVAIINQITPDNTPDGFKVGANPCALCLPSSNSPPTGAVFAYAPGSQTVDWRCCAEQDYAATCDCAVEGSPCNPNVKSPAPPDPKSNCVFSPTALYTG